MSDWIMNINFQVGLRSGLCLGCSNTFLVLKHSSVTLAICRLFSCWKVNLPTLYFSPSILPSALTSFPVSADKKYSQGYLCFSVSTKLCGEKFTFDLIRPEKLFQIFSNMHFGKLQMANKFIMESGLWLLCEQLLPFELWMACFPAHLVDRYL